MYIVIDLCFILGLIGFYSIQRTNLFWLGHLGFTVAICGLGFIAGPDTDIFGTAAYQIGSPVVGLGTLMLSLNLIKAKLYGLIVPISFISSVVFGLVSILVSSSLLFTVTGVLFGVGFIALGVNVWRNC